VTSVAPISPVASAENGQALDGAVSSLVELGQSLVRSYTALERRARRVEDELVRKLAELDAVSRYLEGVLEAIPTGVVVRDGAGKVVRANPAAKVLIERLGMECLDWEDARSCGSWSQRDFWDAQGRRVVLARRCSPLGPQAQMGSVELIDERTALLELQERLHSLDKMAALGTVAGGVAHEIRNPMNAIKGFASMLERRLAHDSDEGRWAALIGSASCQVEEVLSSMLTLATSERLHLETIAPAELLRSAVDLALQELKVDQDPSSWRIEIDADSPPFAGDRIKLRQALRNLVTNAVQAQPDGGVVALSHRVVGEEIRIEVADAGAGIPESVRARILEPFYTTRAQGTGLGLALVSEIARLHGGRIEVSPRPSRFGGASLCLHLPLTCPT
jgi:signal transduction histidine kinase